MKKLTFLVAAVSLALFTANANINASAADCSSPQKYVESLSNDVVNVIKSGAADKAKEDKLTGIFKSVVDSNWMGKFVMGRNWKGLTEDQQKTYLGKYSQYLIASYVPIFREYSGEKVAVNSAKSLEKEGDFMVDTLIDRPGKESVVVNYRVRKAGSCYKVTDILAEGISLINTQRQDFNAVFTRKGYDGLIDSLNAKIAAPQAAAASATAAN